MYERFSTHTHTHRGSSNIVSRLHEIERVKSLRDFNLLQKTKKTILFVVFSFFTVPSFVFATAMYTPGETLNPACGPTNPDCTVSSPALSGSNSDITALSGLTSITSSSLTISNLVKFLSSVGIGTTSPFAKLSVAGSDTTTTLFGLDALTGFTGNLVDLKVASTSVLTVGSDGGITSTGVITSTGTGTSTYSGSISSVNASLSGTLMSNAVTVSNTTPDFTLVVFPDTQYLTDPAYANVPTVWLTMPQWAADNKVSQNIKAVISVGDVTNSHSAAQFAHAVTGYNIAKTASIPVLPIVGNHDYNDDGTTYNDVSTFDSYFGPSYFSGQSWYGSSSYPEGSNENYYITFESGTQGYIIMGLEWEPSVATISWAQGVINANSSRQVIISTHKYLLNNGKRDSSVDTLWNNLIKNNSQIIMVLSGHTTCTPYNAHSSEYSTTTQKVVHQLFVDYQCLDKNSNNANSGYMQILNFKPSQGKIDVSFYSPYLSSYDATTASFSLPYSPVQLRGGLNTTLDLIAGGDLTVGGNRMFLSASSTIYKNGLPFLHTSNADNLYLGSNAGALNNYTWITSPSGSQNTGIGTNVMSSTTSAYGNTAVGWEAMKKTTDGYKNTAIGYNALNFNSGGYMNTAIGASAMSSNATGTENVAIGNGALYGNLNGYQNTSGGVYSLYSNTYGNRNTSFGYSSLQANTSGIRNSAFGNLALYYTTTGGSNVALGDSALRNNAIGNYNTATGYQALFSNTADSNTADGYTALYTNTSGTRNTALGNAAMFSNITGGYNTAIGAQALNFNSSATNTVAIGYRAGYGTSGATASQYNTFVGYQSGYQNTSGNSNTLLGYQAGYDITSGSSNIIIGNNVTATSSTGRGQLNIGNVIFGSGMYGGTSVSSSTISGLVGIATSSPWRTLSVNGTVAFAGLANDAAANALCIDASGNITTAAVAACSGVSSQRYKHDIIDLDLGLPVVLAMRPVSFKFNQGYGDNGLSPQFGLIAEEVNIVDSRLTTLDKDGQPNAVRYDFLAPILIKAIQEQQLQINSLMGSTTSSVSSSGFLQNIFNQFLDFLSSAVAKVKTLFVGELQVDDRLKVGGEVCVDDICVSKDQFKQMLLNAGGSVGNIDQEIQIPSNFDNSTTTPLNSDTTATSTEPAQTYTATTSPETITTPTSETITQTENSTTVDDTTSIDNLQTQNEQTPAPTETVSPEPATESEPPLSAESNE